MKIILASKSPRRRELFSLLELPFEVHAPRYEEITQSQFCPAEEALYFAREKAKSLQKDFPESIIIGCDTIVELNGKKLGKPKDVKHALAMLKDLSGKIHRVLTGVSVLISSTGKHHECLGQTLVKMREISDEEARAYVETDEPSDKAGAYAIQGGGREFIERIEGDYNNVVGLPLKDLGKILMDCGISLSVDLEKLGTHSSGVQ